MDVTQEVLNATLSYGSSGSTQQEYLSTSKSLNFGKGGSINKALKENVSSAGYSVNYVDSIGLQGSENRFVKFDIDIVDTYKDFEGEDGWDPMLLTDEDPDEDNDYYPIIYDMNTDSTVVNTYEPASILSSLPMYPDGYIGIDLENIKTNNIYVDSHLDVRLYTRNKEEHPYNKMYVNYADSFYIGLHARNSKRLPYNIKCTVGSDILPYSEMTEEQRKRVVRSDSPYSPSFAVG